MACRNALAALAVPITYTTFKHGATAAAITYIAHRSTFLDTKHFNSMNLGFRFGFKAVDVVGSILYNYYFRHDIQKIGKTIGYYIDVHLPSYVHIALTDYLIPITKSIYLGADYYLTPYAVVVRELIQESAVQTLDYILSDQFVSDVVDVNEVMHFGPNIPAYELLKNLATTIIFDLPKNVVSTTIHYNEKAHFGPNLCQDDLINFLKTIKEAAIYSHEVMHFGPSFSLKTLPDLYYSFQHLTELIVYLNEKAHFGPDIPSSILDTISNFLSYLADIAIYLNDVAHFGPRIKTQFITPLIATTLELLEKLISIEPWEDEFEELVKIIVDWWNEPSDIMEQLEQFAKDFIVWWNEPSDFMDELSEYATYVASTNLFNIIFISSCKLLFDDYVQSKALKLTLNIVSVKVGFALRDFSEETYNWYATKNKLKYQAALENNRQSDDETTEVPESPNQPVTVSEYSNLNENNIVTIEYDLLPKNITSTITEEQPSPEILTVIIPPENQSKAASPPTIDVQESLLVSDSPEPQPY